MGEQEAIYENICETCKYIATCSCGYCEKAICLFHEIHLQDLTYNEIITSECLEEAEE